MKSPILEIPRPSDPSKWKSKETPQSKRSGSSSSKRKPQKIVANNLNSDFDAASDDLSHFLSDPEINDSPEMSSFVEVLPSTVVSSASVFIPAVKKAKVVNVEATALIDLLKALRDINKSLEDTPTKDLGGEKRSGLSDLIFLMKVKIGVSLSLILIVAVLNFLVVASLAPVEFNTSFSDDFDFDLPPT